MWFCEKLPQKKVEVFMLQKAEEVTAFYGIFLQNYLEGAFVKKWPKNNGS